MCQCLAVSRALGDHNFKDAKFEAHQQMVTCVPVGLIQGQRGCLTSACLSIGNSSPHANSYAFERKSLCKSADPAMTSLCFWLVTASGTSCPMRRRRRRLVAVRRQAAITVLVHCPHASVPLRFEICYSRSPSWRTSAAHSSKMRSVAGGEACGRCVLACLLSIIFAPS